MTLDISSTFTWNETVWNPGMIQTSLWLDAADSSTLTETGGLVSQWRDKSGNLRHAVATGLERPLYNQTSFNNKPGISFDGVGNLLACNDLVPVAIGNDRPWTAIMALNAPQRGISQTLFSFRNLSYVGHTLSLTSSGIVRTDRRSSSDANGVFVNGSTAITGSSQIFALTFYGTSCLMSLNGSDYASGSLNSSELFIDRFTIGADRSSSGTVTYSQFITPEIIFTQGALSTTSRRFVEGYLAHKWEITANLPSSHPFKDYGPRP